MIHHPRVPLFAFQSFICSFDALAHSCDSHPLSCKCSAYLRLSSTITALVVYQARLCPQVWCCLIHHEGFSLLDSSENYLLIGCVHHANTHQDGQSVMNLPPVETYISSMFSHQPSWNCQVIQTWISYLAVKGSLLHSRCSSQWIPLGLANQLIKRNDLASSTMFITHIHAVKCAFELQNRWSHSQSWWVHPSSIHSNATVR